MQKSKKQVHNPYLLFVCGLSENKPTLVKNTYDKSGIDLETKKSDKRLHGFGHRSVKEFAEKNNGIVNFYEEKCDFCANMWIAVNKNRLFTS